MTIHRIKRSPTQRPTSRISRLLAAAVLAAVCGETSAQDQFAPLGPGLPASNDNGLSTVLGDIDGDGDLDLVVGTKGYLIGAQNRLYLNNGNGGFVDVTASHLPSTLDRSSALALGDVDGDGDLDLVVGNGDYGAGSQNRLYLNNGNGVFTDVTASHMPIAIDSTDSVALGDVDGDGDQDLVVGNWGQNRLYLNSGGTFSDATATNLPIDTDYTDSVALGDVDGDGDLDLVCGNSYDHQDRLYLNDGAGGYTDVSATAMPALGFPTSSLALGDVDGDGDLDIMTATEAFQTPICNWDRLLINDGSGGFTWTARLPPIHRCSTAVALGDVDGDGDLDAVWGIWGSGAELYLNLQRQLHAPIAPQIGQPYSLDAYMRYGTSNVANFSVTYLSTAPSSIASMFGTIGLDLAQAVPFPTLIVPQPSGVGSVGFTVPNAPSLVGQAIYSQAMLIAYPHDLRLSNVVRDVIQ
tara:strand:+ start:11630 stop:13027 length:1398 start_codon:yes stop_codon:yes gene_type:complete